MEDAGLGSLSILPDELIQLIASQIGALDLSRLSMTSKALYHICNDSNVWFEASSLYWPSLRRVFNHWSFESKEERATMVWLETSAALPSSIACSSSEAMVDDELELIPQSDENTVKLVLNLLSRNSGMKLQLCKILRGLCFYNINGKNYEEQYEIWKNLERQRQLISKFDGLKILLQVLESANDASLIAEVCAALGNVCNEKNRRQLMKMKTVEKLLKVIKPFEGDAIVVTHGAFVFGVIACYTSYDHEIVSNDAITFIIEGMKRFLENENVQRWSLWAIKHNLERNLFILDDPDLQYRMLKTHIPNENIVNDLINYFDS